MVWVIEAKNEFNDGWLACVLGQPKDEEYDPGSPYADGYRMAEETGRAEAAWALPAMIEKGLIEVTATVACA